MEYGMEKNEAQWVVRGYRGQMRRHFGEPESPKALCGAKLWTARVVVVGSKIPCCARCLDNLKRTAQKLTLEIVSYYFARGKSWTAEQVEHFEGLQDMHFWITQAIQQADKSYQPLSWAEGIKDRQELRERQEVANG